MLTPTHADAYTPYVDQDFVVRSGDASRTMKLVALKPKLDDEVQYSFSLLFSAVGDVWPQQIYTVSHPKLGAFDMFLVPIQSKRGTLLYEAVFNLLKPEDPKS